MLRRVETKLTFECMEDRQSQYSPEEIRNNMIVPARYIRIKGFENNPNISALPPINDQGDFFSRYGDQESEVSVREVNRMSRIEMLDKICLQSCSVPLWYYYDVMRCIRRLLLKSRG